MPTQEFVYFLETELGFTTSLLQPTVSESMGSTENITTHEEVDMIAFRLSSVVLDIEGRDAPKDCFEIFVREDFCP